jgi:hypothetical protein
MHVLHLGRWSDQLSRGVEGASGPSLGGMTKTRLVNVRMYHVVLEDTPILPLPAGSMARSIGHGGHQ